MTGCSDVCMDIDHGEYNEFYADAIRTAKVEHKCGECGRPITSGEQYERATGKTEGCWWTAETCAECIAIRKAVVCGGWLFANLWDDIREHVFPLMENVGAYECLATIESKAARDKLHAAFIEWLPEGDDDD